MGRDCKAREYLGFQALNKLLQYVNNKKNVVADVLLSLLVTGFSKKSLGFTANPLPCSHI